MGSQSFPFTGGPALFTIPDGIGQFTVEVVGGSGGEAPIYFWFDGTQTGTTNGGLGAYIQATFSVPENNGLFPQMQLYISVGGQGYSPEYSWTSQKGQDQAEWVVIEPGLGGWGAAAPLGYPSVKLPVWGGGGGSSVIPFGGGGGAGGGGATGVTVVFPLPDTPIYLPTGYGPVPAPPVLQDLSYIWDFSSDPEHTPPLFRSPLAIAAVIIAGGGGGAGGYGNAINGGLGGGEGGAAGPPAQQGANAPQHAEGGDGGAAGIGSALWLGGDGNRSDSITRGGTGSGGGGGAGAGGGAGGGVAAGGGAGNSAVLGNWTNVTTTSPSTHTLDSGWVTVTW